MVENVFAAHRLYWKRFEESSDNAHCQASAAYNRETGDQKNAEEASKGE